MKMKFVYLSAAVLALGSCSNEVLEDGFADKSNAISFSSYTPKSRAVSGDVTNTNMKGDDFGVAGYTNSDKKIYLCKNTDKGVQQKWIDGSGSGTWEYANVEDLKFWPSGNMDFFAYYPYTDHATFAESDAPGDVMTIAGTNCSHDVLFACATNQSKQPRVPLAFHHAFSKVKGVQIEMPAGGTVYGSKCQIMVKEVAFINTATTGDIKVNNTGVASYGSPATPLSVTLSSDVTLNQSNVTGNLIDNGESAKGYLFATQSSANVLGTGKALWDGLKASLGSSTLSGSDRVCLRLSCKVWNGADANKYYYVGDDANYGYVYIPLTGSNVTDPNPDDVSATAFIAGKRYTYKIVMKDNVGFSDNGDPILTPILFSVDSVDDWQDEVTVTITL